jgi:hypothetical protein
MKLHQTPEEIIKNATAEQRILWNSIFLQFGEKIGISQLHFIGQVATSEFIIYNASKHYLCLSLIAGCSDTSPQPLWGNVTLFDAANGVSNYLNVTTPIWNTTGALEEGVLNTIQAKNFLCSRFTFNIYSHISFLGYRISL